MDEDEIWHWTNAPRQGKVADMSATTIQSVGQIDHLIAGVRAATCDRADWSTTAQSVADRLRAHLPSPGIPALQQRLGSPERAASHTLHVEPDGSFSITAVVWRPDQVTRIHDHATWCAFGGVHNTGDHVAISIHVYRTDITRIGSSVRRYYDLPAGGRS
jgi:predicted metal-dependent enzyme (double-stranded beta helix superfamily)